MILALLCGLGALMLYRAPVQRYVVACERATQVECVLEQQRTAGTQRRRVSFGPAASAVVRVLPQRRGPARILLYLESAPRSVFAAEFEGENAAEAAAAAAERLNGVLRGTSTGAARIEAAPSALVRRLAWGALGVMALLILAGYREARRRPPADETSRPS